MTAISDAHTAMPTIKGKRISITGGTTGIGRAIAILLAAEGARVFICGRDKQHLKDALAAIRAVGDADGMTIDLAKPDSSTRFVEKATAWLGGLDVAIVNAAVAAEALSDMTETDVRYAIATDFTAYLLSTHAAIAKLKRKGDIVLIGSMSAHVLGPGSTVYAGIKYGIQGFAEALRRELGPKGIRVALVEPGKTGSDMQQPDISPKKQRALIKKDEMLRAEDIAVAVHYLLSQPRRAVVQQLTITPRAQAAE